MASILITGASSGIGKALASQLIKEGHEVWGIARNSNLLSQLSAELKSAKFKFSICDVAKPEEWKRVKEEMVLKGFLPEILILNAGIMSIEPQTNYDVNVGGVENAWNAFAAELKKSGGTVAVSGSLFSFVQAPFNLSYSESKLKAYQFLQHLDSDATNSKVRFKYFVLGPVNTSKENLSIPFWKSLFIPSAQKTAAHMINNLCIAGLINIFPFSSKMLMLLNKALPKTLMNVLVTTLKR